MRIDHDYGVPTVALHTSVFQWVVRSVARANGMPHMRQVFVPQPVIGKSPGELRAYIEGNDPVTGRPVMREVIEGLTAPFGEGELNETEFERSTPRLAGPAGEEDLNRLFQENGWTDYLPIILPTEERVKAMLARTSRSPEEVVGHMRPTDFREYWEYTVEKVAVNAVMAGAKPECFPVILAMAPYNHANATIGRAYGLLSQNLQGGSVPGHTYMGSQGNGLAYGSMSFGENEERSPWEPFHMQHGFKPGESAVSLFTGCRATAFSLGLREKHWREHVGNMLRGLDPRTPPTLLLDPLAARMFIDRGGFDTKEKLIAWIDENARMPAGEFWDYQLAQNYIYPRATFGEEPWAERLKAAPDEPIQMFLRKDIHVVVVGGETNPYWRIVGCTYQKTVSVDEWR